MIICSTVQDYAVGDRITIKTTVSQEDRSKTALIEPQPAIILRPASWEEYEADIRGNFGYTGPLHRTPYCYEVSTD